MNSSPQQQIFSVSQLTGSIQNLLEKNFAFVRVQGEISNLKTPYSGHSYFSLKDHSAQIRAVLFKQKKRFVDHDLEEGQEVICFGRVTVYEPRGDYQLIVDSVELYGQGRLQIEFEELKQKLSAKGYFDQKAKKDIPVLPKKIAVISSPTGAAFQDFLKIVRLRRAAIHIQLLPVRVQGEFAADEISRAINTINIKGNCDAIVLCRGGGSIEDLWSFNSENVADAIFSSKIPIITGIGHEIDFTIADFCADFRCPTPTAAAERLSPDNATLSKQVITLRNRLSGTMRDKLVFAEQNLRYQTTILKNVSKTIDNASHRLGMSRAYLYQAINEIIAKESSRLALLSEKLQHQAPTAKLENKKLRMAHLIKNLRAAMEKTLDKKTQALGRSAAILNSVSPLATLARGYSIARKYDQNGEKTIVIRKASEVSTGDLVNILLSEGEFDCLVSEKAGEELNSK